MLNIISHKGNANQDDTEILSTSSQSEWLSLRNQTTNAGKALGQKRTLIYCWWECKSV
jgi:hypothetical protein